MNSFTVIPAIDLKDGKCVRLRQGRAEDATVYAEDPVAMAQHWQAEGARALHVVDLDGAFQGRPVHTALIPRIVAAVTIPVQVGGGLRTDEDLQRYVDAGAARVIVGTRAGFDPDRLPDLAAKFGSALAVSVDARGGRVQVRGWTEAAPLSAVELARRADKAGVQTLVFTDVSRDGMMSGPSLELLRALCEAVSCRVIASGGIASAAHVRALRGLGCPNLAGAIVGRALYERQVTLRELMEA